MHRCNVPQALRPVLALVDCPRSSNNLSRALSSNDRCGVKLGQSATGTRFQFVHYRGGTR